MRCPAVRGMWKCQWGYLVATQESALSNVEEEEEQESAELVEGDTVL